jgi:hypothetical protein
MGLGFKYYSVYFCPVSPFCCFLQTVNIRWASVWNAPSPVQDELQHRMSICGQDSKFLLKLWSILWSSGCRLLFVTKYRLIGTPIARDDRE